MYLFSPGYNSLAYVVISDFLFDNPVYRLNYFKSISDVQDAYMISDYT